MSFTRPSVSESLKQPEQPLIRRGFGPSAVKFVGSNVVAAADNRSAVAPKGRLRVMRASAAAATRTHAGSNRPIGYVIRSFHCASSRSRSAGSPPGPGMYRSAVVFGSRRSWSNGRSKLRVARQIPVEKRINAAKMRGRKTPEEDEDFISMLSPVTHSDLYHNPRWLAPPNAHCQFAPASYARCHPFPAE